MSKWEDLVLLHKNIEGARAGFETACTKIITLMNPQKAAHGIRVNQGDGGIDVYVGDFGNAPIDVYQCKYFIGKIEDAQKKQIRDSYTTAVNSTDFTVKDWYLCLPIALDTKETSWFNTWSKNLTPKPILYSEARLMAEADKLGISDDIFQRKDSAKLDWIMQRLASGTPIVDKWAAFVSRTERDCTEILRVLVSELHKCIEGISPYLDQLAEKANGGDQLALQQYPKSYLMSQDITDDQKTWLYVLVSDFTLVPIVYRFMQRYQLLINEADSLNLRPEIAASELYSLWGFLRADIHSELRKKASWPVDF